MTPNVHSIKLEKFLVKIVIGEEYGILPEHMISFDFNQSIDDIMLYATLVISDNIQMSDEILFDATGEVIVEFKDVFENTFSYTFSILKIQSSILGGKDPILSFKLVLKDQLPLLYTSDGSGFLGTVNDILGALEEYNVKFDFKTDFKDIINYVYPINKNILYTLEYFRSNYNLFLFSTFMKKEGEKSSPELKYRCFDFEKLIVEEEFKQDDIIFALRHTNFDYYYQIQDIMFKHPDNLKTIENFPTGEIYNINMFYKNFETIDDISMKKVQTDNTLAGNYDKIAYLETPKARYVRSTLNPKINKSNSRQLQYTYMSNVLDQMSIEITSNGDLGIQPGFIVSVVIPDSGINTDLSEKYNKNKSGRYLITSVHTKIQNRIPLQKMVLTRIDDVKEEIIQKMYK